MTENRRRLIAALLYEARHRELKIEAAYLRMIFGELSRMPWKAEMHVIHLLTRKDVSLWSAGRGDQTAPPPQAGVFP